MLARGIYLAPSAFEAGFVGAAHGDEQIAATLAAADEAIRGGCDTMSSYDVYALGNALVDMEFSVDDGFLRRHRIDKGHMTLVDEPRLDELLGQPARPRTETDERRFGGEHTDRRAGIRLPHLLFVQGRRRRVGRVFLEGPGTIGVATNRQKPTADAKSGRCLVLITPDAERSMSTFLGISDKLAVSEVDESALREFAIPLHRRIPEFVVDRHATPRSAVANSPKSDGIKTAMTLSDASMVGSFASVDRRCSVTALIISSATRRKRSIGRGTDRLDIAVAELKDIARSVNVTLGARGSVVINGHDRWEVPGFPVKPIDTNGAGDIYAGACLAGWNAGMPPQVAARFGNFAAARLITRYGARLATMADYQSRARRLPQASDADPRHRLDRNFVRPASDSAA